jgi:phosphoglucomutase/phosphomannomutase
MATTEGQLARVAEAAKNGKISNSSAENIRRWLTETPYKAYVGRLSEDIATGKWKELDDAFYTVIDFGTGGRRGRMYPVGTNVLNDRTLAESARGLADHVRSTKPGALRYSCVIAYDTRHNSRSFAEICARVLVAAGFEVALFDSPRSTPLLSFAVRDLGCDAGIMITASHNPPSDNGFKCYDAHGNQVVPPDDTGIIACVKASADREIPEADFDASVRSGKIRIVGQTIDDAYIAAVVSESVSRARDISIVYTPLHGVGETSVAAALRTDGFSRVNVLAAQRTPDGDFPTVPGHVANPEFPKALDAAIAEARATGADLVLASDPDADRIGVGLPLGDPKGDWTTLDGNQIGALLAAFVMKETEAMGKLRNDHYLVTTLVTGQMAKALAQREGVRVVDDLPVGFKWIGKTIDEFGPFGFLFGFEESHGYLKGGHVRDKDAAVAALLFAELAAAVKDRKQTVLEYLDDLYIDVGHFGERLLNKTFDGRTGQDKIKALMRAFREVPPTQIGNLAITEVRDYQQHLIRRPDGSTELLPEPTADLLMFELAAPGCRFAVRPSGTEPKMKLYLFARSDTPGATEPGKLAAVKAQTEARLDQMAADLEKYIQTALIEFGD